MLCPTVIGCFGPEADSRDAIKTSIHTVRRPSGTPAKRMPSATRSPSREISWMIASFVESATPAADREASVKRKSRFYGGLFPALSKARQDSRAAIKLVSP